MSTILGYSVVEHHDDGSTKVINKVSADTMTALLAGGGIRGGNKNTYLNADECPVHGPWKAIPSGVSKNTGKPYPAFWTCDTEQGTPRCTNRPSNDWIETHPVEPPTPDQAPTPEPPPAPTDAGQFDDLPF